MSNRNLLLKVIFTAKDGLSGPLGNIVTAGKSASDKLSAMRKEAGGLAKTQRTVEAFQKLKREAQDTGQQLDAARLRATRLGADLKKTENPTVSLKNEFKKAREEVTRLETRFRDQHKTLNSTRSSLASAGIGTANLANHQRDLAKKIGDTNSRIEQQQDRLTRLGKASAQAEKMRQRGQDLRSSGTGNMMGGVAMAAPMVVAAKQAMTFEGAMADVRKVVDFDSPKEFQQMGEDIVDMSTKIPMAAEGLAQIVAAAGRAGIARKELLTFATDAAQMGIAFDTTAEDAGNMMAKWRTAFAMGQDEVRGLSDQINALTNTYGGNVGAVAGVVTRIGSLGKVAGLSAPQIAAMAQVMNSVGVEEEVAATGVKNMMLAMTKGSAATKAQSKAYAALGLDAKKVAEAMQKDAGGAITDLLTRIRKLPEAQQAATLTQLFGSESVSALAPMLTNLEKLQANFELVGDKTKYAGSMNKEYLARIATTEGAVGLASNALKGVNITLGTLLLPTITAASAKVVELANGVRNWAKENPGLAKGLAMAWATLSGLVIGVGALKIGLGLLLSPLATLIGWVPKLAPVLTVARFAVLGLAKGVMTAGAMMLANPVVAAIVAIVAALGVAGYLVYKHWDTIHGAFKSGVTAVQGWLSGLPDWMKSLGSMMMQGLLMSLHPAILADRLIAIARSGITAFKNFFGIKSPSRLMIGMGGYITEGLSRGIDRGAGGAVSAARSMAAGVAGAAALAALPATSASASPFIPPSALAAALATSANASPVISPAALAAAPAVASIVPAPTIEPTRAAAAAMIPASLTPRDAATAARPEAITITIGQVTITVNAAPGQSPQEIAEAVAEELKKQAASAAAAKRSRYEDEED